MIQFGHMRDIVDLQLTGMVRILEDSWMLDQIVKVHDSYSEANDLLLKMESQHNILTSTKEDWKTSCSHLKFVYKDIMPLAMQTP